MSRVRELQKAIERTNRECKNKGPLITEWFLLFASDIAMSLAVIADAMTGNQYSQGEVTEEDIDKTEYKNPEFFKLGERIRKRLDEIGMSQRELADKLGITEVSLSRYIKGERIPRATVVIGIAKVLDVSVEWLLKGEK